MITKRVIYEHLKKVLDPELGINIVDLGLIYDVKVVKNNVWILMTLTFPGCPLGGTIKNEVNEKLSVIENLGKIELNITFNPPWDLSKISEEARAEIGI